MTITAIIYRNAWALAAIVLVVAGCGDESGQTTSTLPKQDLQQIEIIEPGEECEAGGVRISTGSDDNGNGILDPEEVESSIVFCNGGPGEQGPVGDPGAGGGDGTDALVDLIPVAPGDDCPSGGVEVISGFDENDNGELDDDEIEDRALACDREPGLDGEDGAASLVRVDELQAGDPLCAYGGAFVAAGLDDGDGDDGVAGDGILQDGEVDVERPVCEGNPPFPLDRSGTEPPEGALGSNVIDLSGGDSSGRAGGSGGSFSVEMDPGSLTGHIKFFETGSLDPVVSLPDFDTSLGDEPFVVDAGEVVVESLNISAEPPVVGQVYTELGDATLWRAVEGADPVAITGVRVEAGARLVFEYNDDDNAFITMRRGFHNAGAVSAVNGSEVGSLTLNVNWYRGEEGSTIDLSAPDAPGGTARDGSNLTVSALRVASATDIDLSGGDGFNGGAGGRLFISGTFGITSTGTVVTRGGAGTEQPGGAGGSQQFQSISGTVELAGALDLSGGTGVAGAPGGFLQLASYYLGDLVTTADITANGGDAIGVCVDAIDAGEPGPCEAGTGGSIDIVNYGDGLTVAGAISTVGGSSNDGLARQGGPVTIRSQRGKHPWITPQGHVEIDASFDLRGGDGAGGGGAGGQLSVWLRPDAAPAGQEIRFYGLSEIDLEGGTGLTGAGAGGVLSAFNRGAQMSGFPGQYGPSGGVINTVDIFARGGGAVAGSGNDGGTVHFRTEESAGWGAPQEIVINAGDIDVRAGGADNGDGGSGGSVILYGQRGVESSGEIRANGGSVDPGCLYSPDRNVFCAAGEGGSVSFEAQLGEVLNSGALRVFGGDSLVADGSGGPGGTVSMDAEVVTSSAAIDAHGGDSSDDQGNGGIGGTIELQSYEAATTNSGELDVSGGLGDSLGSDGSIRIDGVLTAD